MDDRTHLLVSIFTAIEEQSWADTLGIDVVTLYDIKQVFKNAGVDIDKLRENEEIN